MSNFSNSTANGGIDTSVTTPVVPPFVSADPTANLVPLDPPVDTPNGGINVSILGTVPPTE